MRRPTRKEGWETSDEKFFTSHPEACIHEENLATREKIERWVIAHCHHGMTLEDIIDLLVKHGDELNQTESD